MSTATSPVEVTPIEVTPVDVAPVALPADANQRKIEIKNQGGSGGAVYGLGMIGAWVFYFSRVTTVREGVFAFLKGLVWPAFMVYDALAFLDDAKKRE